MCLEHLLWPNPDPGSHPGGISPGGEGVQVKHGPAPAVDGQRDAEDADEVHDDAGPGLREEKKAHADL